MGANGWDSGGICSDSAADCGGTSPPLWATNLHHLADGKTARWGDYSRTFEPALTVASPDLGQVAAAFAGLFAEFDHVPACCLGGDGHLSHSLFPIAEVHCQYHLRNRNSVMRADGIKRLTVMKNSTVLVQWWVPGTQAPTFCLHSSMWRVKITSFSPRAHQITFTRY